MAKVLFNHLYKMSLSVNFPKTSGPRSQAWLRFCLITYKDVNKYEFGQSIWSEEPSMIKVLFNTWKE